MSTHHAVLVTSFDRTLTLDAVRAKYAQTAEVVSYMVESLTIDDVRRIIQLAYQTPAQYTIRQLVVSARSINVEAQHALLKVIEEPPSTTRFTFILPSIAGLLPTIMSRVSWQHSSESAVVYPAIFTEFIAAPIAKRLEVIADIVKRKADTDWDQLYDGLVVYSEGATHDYGVLLSLEPALRYLRQKGAAKKMIWEVLALTLPTTDAL
jgi:hypothetical protein